MCRMNKKQTLDGMNKKEWQDHYKITDEEMKIIELVLKVFNGRITSVNDK